MNNCESLLLEWREKFYPDELVINDAAIPDAELIAYYTERFDLEFSWFRETGIKIETLLNDSARCSVKFPGQRSLSLIPLSLRMKNEGFSAELVPTRQPCILHSVEHPKSINFTVLCGPRMFFDGFELSLEYKDISMIYKEDKNYKEAYRRSRRAGKILVSGTITVTKATDETISFEEAFEAAYEAQRFFTFLQGSDVSIGHAVGKSKGSETVLLAGGFNRRSQLARYEGWYGISQVKDLPTLFKLFCNTKKDKECADVLHNALEYYRASATTQTSSIEMAVVAAAAALEVLVPFVLKKRAWHDSELLARRIPFHSKLRACFGVLSLQGDPLEGLENISKNGRFNGKDLFEIVTMFRNRIVHSGDQFEYTGAELFEVWNAQMWLIELIGFSMVGYTGSMRDRRPISGWSGGETLVPVCPMKSVS